MRVKKAEYVKDYKVKLLFSDGVSKVVDFKPFLISTRKIVLPLVDIEYFKNFDVDEITICWPNGLDFSPDILYKAGETQQEPKKSIKPSTRHSRKQPILESRVTCRPKALTKKRPKNI